MEGMKKKKYNTGAVFFPFLVSVCTRFCVFISFAFIPIMK